MPAFVYLHVSNALYVSTMPRITTITYIYIIAVSQLRLSRHCPPLFSKLENLPDVRGPSLSAL